MQMLPKIEIKKTLGRSPDDLDALLMRMYFELGTTLMKARTSM